MKRVIILGSARSDGNTAKVIDELRNYLECDLIDLNGKEINQFDYDHKHRNDDFLPLIRKITAYDLIVFATPVYWYSMSGLMKVFFDRITDCLKIEKDTGRKLRGKHMVALSCGSEAEEVEGFFIPFSRSAEYLGMKYTGNIHTWIEDELPTKEVKDRIMEFAAKLDGL